MDHVPEPFHSFDTLPSIPQPHPKGNLNMTEVADHSEGSLGVVEHRKFFGRLEKSTLSFLSTLEEWRNQSDFSVDPLPYSVIATRALVAEFVKTYEVGLSAAQDGYNFAKSGLMYPAIITSDTSLAERDSYIAQMQSCATQGKTKSEQALESMRDLRRKLNPQLDMMKSASRKGSAHGVQKDIEVFNEKTLFILREFEECMGWYIKWWTETGMTSSYQETNVIEYAQNGGDLRLRGIQVQWKDLKDVYSHYRTEMQKIQDQYSRVFKLVHDLKPNDRTDVLTHPLIAPMSEGRTLERQGFTQRHDNSSPPILSAAGGASQPSLNDNPSPQRQASTRGPLKPVLVDSSPKAPVNEPEIQPETIRAELQRPKESKPDDYESRSTGRRLNQSAKLGIGRTPTMDNRNSGQQNRKSSNEGERLNEKPPVVISNPLDVSPLDDSLALLKAWTASEGSFKGEDNTMGERQSIKASQVSEKDDSLSHFGPGRTLTDPDNTQSHRNLSSSYPINDRLGGRPSPQIVQTHSKKSIHTQNKPSSSGSNRQPSERQKISVEQEAGYETGNKGVVAAGKQAVGSPSVSDNDSGHGRGASVSKPVKTHTDGTEGSNDENHRMTPVKSSFKRSASKAPRDPVHQTGNLDHQHRVTQTTLVPTENAPNDAMKGPDSQKATVHPELQKPKESKASDVDSNSMSMGRESRGSGKPDSSSATTADNHSSGRRKPSDEGQKSNKKAVVAAAVPSEVPPPDDSLAWVAAAWTTDEDPSKHTTSVTVQEGRHQSKLSRPNDKDELPPLFEKETMLGDTDKSYPFHIAPTSKNGKSRGHHHNTSPQLLDSKVSNLAQTDPTASNLKRPPSADRRISVEKETGDKFGNIAASPEAKHLSDLGDVVSKKVDTPKHDLHGPSSNFSKEEAHAIAASTSSRKSSLNRSASKRSGKATIQTSIPDIKLLPPSSADIELTAMPTSHSSLTDNIRHQSQGIPSKSDRRPFVPTNPSSSTNIEEQPIKPRKFQQIESLSSLSSAGGAQLEQQARWDSPKVDPLSSVPERIGLSASLTLPRGSEISSAPSQSIPPLEKHSKGNVPREKTEDSSALASSRDDGRSGSGRGAPKSEEGKGTPNAYSEEGSSQKARSLKSPQISSKPTSSKISSTDGPYPMSSSSFRSESDSRPSQLPGEVPAQETHSYKSQNDLPKENKDHPAAVSRTITEPNDTVHQGTPPRTPRLNDSSSSRRAVRPERQKSSAAAPLPESLSENKGTALSPPLPGSIPSAGNHIARNISGVSHRNAAEPEGMGETRNVGSENGGSVNVISGESATDISAEVANLLEEINLTDRQEYFEQLQMSTNSFLQNLEAWRLGTDFSANRLPATTAICSLVAEYVAAFEVGLSAAVEGYDLATKGLSCANLITSGISLTERQRYIAEMQSFAAQGKTNAEKTLESMRELRRTLKSRLNGMRTASGRDAVFEKFVIQFEEYVDQSAKWWTQTGMTSSYHKMNVTRISESPGDSRLQSVLFKWMNLQECFSHYQTEMENLRLRHIAVFRLALVNNTELISTSLDAGSQAVAAGRGEGAGDRDGGGGASMTTKAGVKVAQTRLEEGKASAERAKTRTEEAQTGVQEGGGCGCCVIM